MILNSGLQEKQEQIRRKKRWKQYKRAGKFPEELDKPYSDKNASLSWLKKGSMCFDGERIILAAQDQGLLNNGFKKMTRMQTNDQCRFCKSAVESHSVSACPIMLADIYHSTQPGLQVPPLDHMQRTWHRHSSSVGARP